MYRKRQLKIESRNSFNLFIFIYLCSFYLFIYLFIYFILNIKVIRLSVIQFLNTMHKWFLLNCFSLISAHSLGIKTAIPPSNTLWIRHWTCHWKLWQLAMDISWFFWHDSFIPCLLPQCFFWWVQWQARGWQN